MRASPRCQSCLCVGWIGGACTTIEAFSRPFFLAATHERSISAPSVGWQVGGCRLDFVFVRLEEEISYRGMQCFFPLCREREGRCCLLAVCVVCLGWVWHVCPRLRAFPPSKTPSLQSFRWVFPILCAVHNFFLSCPVPLRCPSCHWCQSGEGKKQKKYCPVNTGCRC